MPKQAFLHAQVWILLHDARVIARFGGVAGPALAKAARTLEADYAASSSEFRLRHPELGGDAVDALAWSAAYDRG